jgi:predicted hotdog family 3-hydroxylacyl-ACP dehydratase
VLSRAEIAARIPPPGDMCLRDGVIDWSPDHIRCRPLSHRAPANPLRGDDRLGAASGIEYGAQAMALHGALLGADEGLPRQGYLASVRGVTLHVVRLDDVAEDLIVAAERISGEGGTVMYAFSLLAGSRCLVEGSAMVILDAARLAPAAGAER